MATVAKRTVGILQQIGKSLMLPIAVLPAAAILLRIGALIMEYNTEGSTF